MCGRAEDRRKNEQRNKEHQQRVKVSRCPQSGLGPHRTRRGRAPEASATLNLLQILEMNLANFDAKARLLEQNSRDFLKVWTPSSIQ